MIELIALTAFTVYGCHTLLDNLLHTFTKRNLSDWYGIYEDRPWAFILKPLGACPVCMTSVYGIPSLYAWSLYLSLPLSLLPFAGSLAAVAAFLYVINRI